MAIQRSATQVWVEKKSNVQKIEAAKKEEEAANKEYNAAATESNKVEVERIRLEEEEKIKGEALRDHLLKWRVDISEAQSKIAAKLQELKGEKPAEMSVLKPKSLLMDFSRAAIEERDKAAIQQKRLMEAKRMEADKALEKLQGSFEDFKLFKKRR